MTDEFDLPENEEFDRMFPSGRTNILSTLRHQAFLKQYANPEGIAELQGELDAKKQEYTLWSQEHPELRQLLEAWEVEIRGVMNPREARRKEAEHAQQKRRQIGEPLGLTDAHLQLVGFIRGPGDLDKAFFDRLNLQYSPDVAECLSELGIGQTMFLGLESAKDRLREVKEYQKR